MTPLHHTLLSDFGGGKTHPGPDEIYETVKVLMEFGANQNVEGPRRYICERPMTAREHGVTHPYHRVRALFSNRFGDSLHNTSEARPHSRHIGRTWMLPTRSPICATDCDGLYLTKHIGTECFFNRNTSAKTSEGDQKQPDSLDLSSFPVLDSTNQSHISSLMTHCSDGAWSPAKVDSLIAGLSVVSESESASITGQSPQAFDFPELNSRISKNSLETEASKLWADLGRPRGQPVAEKECCSSAGSEKDSPQGKRGTKERGTKRWQPLKF